MTRDEIEAIYRAELILHDLGILERAWRRYQHQHPHPAFTPTIEQLPHFPHGEIQVRLC